MTLFFPNPWKTMSLTITWSHHRFVRHFTGFKVVNCHKTQMACCSTYPVVLQYCMYPRRSCRFGMLLVKCALTLIIAACVYI